MEKEDNMKQRIEDWINQAPEGLTITPIEVERIEEPLMSMGGRLPVLVTKGYGITIRAITEKYTE